MIQLKKIKLFLILALLFASCKPENKPAESTETTNSQEPIKEIKISAPPFDADSTYDFIKKQVAFGYRIPGTSAHVKCGDWIMKKLKQYGLKTELQTGTVEAYNGTTLPLRNILAYVQPEKQKKILIFAHYDSRPWADQEDDPKKQKLPVLAANDAGSGVAVMLEMARQFSKKQPDVGIIFFFTDVEDYGVPAWDKRSSQNDDSYALGTQFWAKKLDPEKKAAEYGILLDMVGAKNAHFLQEGESIKTPAGQNVVTKLWTRAAQFGYNNYFIYNLALPGIIDDHFYMNKYATFPSVDIVDYDQNNKKGFADYWHTLSDNMDIIDKNTLKAVGETVESVIYDER